MGALGGLIDSAIDKVAGNSHGTTLQDFLTKFSPHDGKLVNTIDTLNTFDVSIKFHPPLEGDSGNSGIGEFLANNAMQMASNAINNVTGGLASSIADAIGSGSNTLQQAQSSHKAGKISIMKYLSDGNLITSSDSLIGSSSSQSNSSSPTELQIGYYVQNITVPMLKVADGGKSDTQLGSFPLVGSYVGPDNNQLQMTMINTKVPLFERLFYPWMRETTLPFWSYDTQPYTTATITIDFSKHADISYVFYGCRPQQIGTIQPTQEPDGAITRDITFIFDFMFVNSTKKTKDSLTDSLIGAGKQLAGTASKMLGI